ncbi:3-hydroxyacyl-CoA dehydrogenase family protein [Luethyella okanaganae]|uniref:3-hydroxyacyl-CoA dehydrogenase family protein n=1 Tax=Luethyella okanaganae TaxID=69372 RepID=A0ABW1VBZ6_9MICO
MSEGVTRVPAVVGVLGGGRMGAGIAHAFLLAGAEVTIVERDASAANAARDRILASVAKSEAAGGLVESAGQLVSRVRVASDLAALTPADLVIEAVPEDLALKRDALRRVEETVAPLAWLATNTSSLSIGALSSVLDRPERFLGMHFFNPVPVSELVELVTGPDTDAELVSRARGWVLALGKTAIVVADAPGFASSRLGVVVALEAIRMLEDGVATAEDIDTAMVLGYRFPVGPLRLTDIVGLDVRLGIAEYLNVSLGERFAPPRLLRDKVARGELGRKSGRGFFDWERTPIA